jgi:hypothetical protein
MDSLKQTLYINYVTLLFLHLKATLFVNKIY